MFQNEKRTLRLLWATALAAAVLAAPTTGREWKSKPKSAAADYLTISDKRPTGDGIFIIWLAQPILEGAFPKMPELKDALDHYVVLGTMHMQKRDGNIAIDETETPVAQDAQGTALTLLPAQRLPPELNMLEAMLQFGLRRSLTQRTGSDASDTKEKLDDLIRRGFRFFVFDTGTVHACTAGKLQVRYAGETYSYDTPVPGC